MYVACSTLCFGKLPLPQALRTIGEMHFQKIDLAIHERGPHLKPSEVAADVPKAALLLRSGFNLVVGAIHAEIDAPTPAEYARQLKAICRLARVLTAPTVCIPAAPAHGDLDAETDRLSALNDLAAAEGVILTIETNYRTLTADPAAAVELCKRVPGLGLTLDPTHYQIGTHRDTGYDAVYPFVRHVRLRDSGFELEQFQVRVGQGCVDYGKIVAHLTRCKYDRLLTVDIRDIPDAPFPMAPEVRKLKYLLESLV